MGFKLNSPHEWLLEKAQHWKTDALYKALSGLAYRLDGQSIRDLFHSEMDSDGYFDKKTKSNADAFDAESWEVTDGIHDGSVMGTDIGLAPVDVRFTPKSGHQKWPALHSA